MDEAKKITAQDIRHQEFSTKMRGYDRVEVDEYLAIIADMLEKDAGEKTELNRQISLLEKQMEDYKNLESTLKNTLIRTQESVDDVKRSAEREGELIVREAQVKADRLIDEKTEKIKKLEASCDALQRKWDEYFVKFKNMLNSHLDILDKMQKDYDGITGRSADEPDNPDHSA